MLTSMSSIYLVYPGLVVNHVACRGRRREGKRLCYEALLSVELQRITEDEGIWVRSEKSTVSCAYLHAIFRLGDQASSFPWIKMENFYFAFVPEYTSYPVYTCL